MGMNERELHRIEIIKKVYRKEIRVSKAAAILNLSLRQVGRLKKNFKEQGPKGIVSKKIGAKGNRRISETQKQLVLDFFKDENHKDFGPTLVHKLLVEKGVLVISVSSVRTIMKNANLSKFANENLLKAK